MSDEQSQNPQGERLYRFHPTTGFTEVNATESANASATTYAEQNMVNAQTVPPIASVGAPVGVPVGPQVGAPSFAQPVHISPQAQPMYAHPFAQPVHPFMTMPMQNVQPTQVPTQYTQSVQVPMQATQATQVAPTMPSFQPHTAEIHALHMQQMQELANAQAMYMAQMAYMAQNAGQSAQANAQAQVNAQAQANAQNTEFSQERMQAMYQTVTDVMNGTAEPSKILGLFQGISTEFWKGAALGATLIALYNYTPLKEVIGTSLATLLATAGLTPKPESTDDGFDDEEGNDKVDNDEAMSNNPEE